MKRSTAFLLIAFLVVPMIYRGFSANKQEVPAPYDEILERFRKVYEPLVEKQGGRFIIEQDWNQTILSAFADRRGSKGEDWVLGIWAGGVYSHPGITPDGFTFMACHEMGHLFGGAPRRYLPPEWDGPSDTDGLSLLSAEGEADYYASLKCMRLILADEDNLAVISHMSVDPLVAKQCHAQYSDPRESALCQRSAMAGQAFLHWMNPRIRLAFDKPSQMVVEKSYVGGYPDERQCRLDTMLAGALCKVDPKVMMDRNDPTVGACSPKNGDKVGSRPACWFKN